MLLSFINNFPKEVLEKTKTNAEDYINSDGNKFFSLNMVKYSKGLYFINNNNNKKNLLMGKPV